MTTISTTELHQRLDDPHLTIVDVRPLVAYNGWHRGGVARGGHVPGAVAFPVAWIDTVDEVEIQRLLDSKGVIAGREIAVYGDGDVDAAAFVTRLGSARHRRTPGSSRAGLRPGPPTRPCRSSACRTTTSSSTSPGSARCSTVAGPRRRRTAPSCCSTSTSGCPRSTPRATSRVPCSSTPTGSRIRPTGTDAHPR